MTKLFLQKLDVKTATHVWVNKCVCLCFFNRGEERIRAGGWTKSWNREWERRGAVLLCPNRTCRLSAKGPTPCVELAAVDRKQIVPWLRHRRGVSGWSTFHKCCLRLQVWRTFLCSCTAFTRISWLSWRPDATFQLAESWNAQKVPRLTVGSFGNRRVFSVIAYSWTWDLVTPQVVGQCSCCGACAGKHSAWYSDSMSHYYSHNVMFIICTTPHPSSDMLYFSDYTLFWSISWIS